MGENSAIEWTHHTFNPWRGCSKIAPGCTNCYADALSKRNPGTLGVWGEHRPGGAGGTRVMASAAYWREPVKWNAAAQAAGERRRVFCASLADVFEDWDGPIVDAKGNAIRYLSGDPECMIDRGPATMDMLRRDLFAMIDATPWLDWLLLTKRPENILKMWPVRGEQRIGSFQNSSIAPRRPSRRVNVWLLTSIAEQADVFRNVDPLLDCRDLVPVLGISAEPLVGPVDLGLRNWADNPKYRLDWVIVGGESGPGARPMHPDWPRFIHEDCAAAGVPFFFKQWGEWFPVTRDIPFRLQQLYDPKWHVWENEPDEGVISMKVGKKAAGRVLDGRLHDEYPRVAVRA